MIKTRNVQKKISLLGDFAVGKTSLVRRFIYDFFEADYLSTLGVKVSRKVLLYPQAEMNTQLTLLLWDLSGSETFDRMRTNYLRGTVAALLVCDLTRSETLDSLRTYAADLLRINPQAQFVVAANKSDLVTEQQLAIPEIKAVADELHAIYYLTSAKTGDAVEKMFRRLGKQLI
ncbi:MAG TPA: GTP-binding protein [Thermoflexia bacterium]|nr:GTP-binding protein [Thermoflexia bacterium]